MKPLIGLMEGLKFGVVVAVITKDWVLVAITIVLVTLTDTIQTAFVDEDIQEEENA